MPIYRVELSYVYNKTYEISAKNKAQAEDLAMEQFDTDFSSNYYAGFTVPNIATEEVEQGEFPNF